MNYLYKLQYFLFLITSLSYPQEKYNSLLWEISGNGLSKPSYLYGTIHVTEEKFFNLSDSVYLAIESTESFAGEISMDSIQYIALKIAGAKQNSSQDISKILNKEELERLDKKLKEILGVDLASLHVKNPVLISFMLKKDLYSSKMSSIDEYLYRIAKEKGKAILGLENIDDQLNLLLNISDEEAREMILNSIDDKKDAEEAEILKKLFDAYLEENLDKIAELVSSAIIEGTETDTKFLVERNLNMAEKIDLFVKEKSIFAAVGAAHLPGKEGILSLLKEKGYSIRPVKPVHTGLAGKYKEPIKSGWVSFSPPSGGFTIEMPGTPAELPMNNKIPGLKIESGFYSQSDISYFAVKYIYPSVIQSTNQDSVLLSLINNLKRGNYNVEEITDIEFENLHGKNFVAKVSSLVSSSKIFIRDNSLYWIQILAPKDKITSPSVEHFFNSFKITPDSIKKPGSEDKSFFDKQGAFKINFASEPYHQELNNDGQISHLYTAGDASNHGVDYLMYSDILTGPSFYNDSITIYRQIEGSAAKGKLVSVEKIPGEYPCYKYIVTYGKEMLTGRAIMRAGRYYVAAHSSQMEFYDSSYSENYLNSFELTDVLLPEWKEYKSPDSSFTINLPGIPSINKDTLTRQTKYLTTYLLREKNSGIPFTVYRYIMSDYYMPENDSVLFSLFLPTFYSGYDTIANKIYLEGKLKINDIIIQQKESKSYNRYKTIINGNSVYSFIVSAPKNLISSESVEPFFNSIEINEENNFDLYSDKSGKLFEDLQSQDSVIRKYAASYVSDFNVKEKDLNKIYELLTKEFPDDNSENGVRRALLNTLPGINNDMNINFIKTIYPSLSGKPELQSAALQVLTKINSDKSINLFLDFILTNPPLTDNSFLIFFPFYDSLSNLSKLFPRILKLISYDEYKEAVLGMLGKGIEESVIVPSQYSSYEEEILKYMNQVIAERDSTDEQFEYSWYMGDIVKIIPSFKNRDEVKNILTKLLTGPADFVLSSSVISMAQIGEIVDPAKINEIASNPGLRNLFYEDLEKISRTDIFPPQYYTSESFAEGDLFNILNDDEYPAELNLIDSLVNEEGKFYMYKFMLEGEEGTWYTGISGPQPAGDGKLVTSAKKTKTNYEILDEKSIKEHWNDLLKDETSDYTE